MTTHKEWNEFLEILFSSALFEYRNSEEYQRIKEKREQIDARIAERFSNEDVVFYEECAFELLLDEERKHEFIYRKGITDCVVILKELGVLA